MRRVFPVIVAAAWAFAACGGGDTDKDGGILLDVRAEAIDLAFPQDGEDREAGEDAVVPQDVPEDFVAPDPGANDTAGQDTAIQDPGVQDPGANDTGVKDTAVTDPGIKDTYDPDAPVGGCDPCGYGTVSGMTCAPNTKTAMPFVKVWVDTTDCNGMPIHVETHSDYAGNYTLEGVPCGTQTIYMQKGSFAHLFVRWIDKGMTTVATSHDACFPGTAARVAVVTGKWDAIENTLVNLWFHFNMFDGLMEGADSGMPEGARLLGGQEAKDKFGAKKKLLDDFDILFINCGDSPDWILDEMGTDVVTTLRQFVMNGNSVYISDWASVYMTRAWPAAWNGSLIRDFPGNGMKPLEVQSTVVDTDLAAYLQKPTARIDYGLSPLTSITGTGPTETMVHLKGPNSAHDNDIEPFMISFQPYGETGGRVIYTNFHNDEQPKEGDMSDILQYVVFLM